MKSAEKRKRFHEALVNILYPPPPSPPQPEEKRDEIRFSFESITDDLGQEKISSSSSDNDVEECQDGAGKLTRAQRKRIRKKKLKEAVTGRRKIIGPLLPTAGDEVVRENVTEKAGIATGSTELPARCPKQNKLRGRRMAKKKATEASISSRAANEDQ